MENNAKGVPERKPITGHKWILDIDSSGNLLDAHGNVSVTAHWLEVPVRLLQTRQSRNSKGEFFDVCTDMQ